MLFFKKIFFDISLSIADIDEMTPECVYFIPNVSKNDWIYPSSPNLPCKALNIISGLKFLIVFKKL